MKWISVNDKLPENEQQIIVGEYWYTEDSEGQYYNYKIYNQKDWMPLPDAPKKEQTHNKVGLSNQ